MSLISFVIPCYRSEATIHGVIEEIRTVIGKRVGYDYEIIAVNDASPDGVYTILKALAYADKKIKVVNLAKNGGKDAAVFAGYKFVKGDYVVNLDDDGQCPVSELWQLLELVERDECDIATARYLEKKESGWRLAGSKANKYIEAITLDKEVDSLLENYFVSKRFIIEEVVKYKNPFPYFAGSVSKTTNRVKAVKMAKRDRCDGGVSGYTFYKSIMAAFAGMTNFSVKPLRLATLLGLILVVIAFIAGIFIVKRKMDNPSIAMGWTSVMATLLFSSGVQVMLLGIMGEYIGRIFVSINNVPQYVIKETINL